MSATAGVVLAACSWAREACSSTYSYERLYSNSGSSSSGSGDIVNIVLLQYDHAFNNMASTTSDLLWLCSAATTQMLQHSEDLLLCI